ncbi:MAG: hypothetical protein ABIW46_08545 [Acidimicrobiales bacterium]
MAVLVAAQAVAIALLAVLVAGLLRSHARVLAALSELGVTLDDRGEPGTPIGLASRPGGARSDAGAALDLVGVTPDDESLLVTMRQAGVDTLLAFLSAGCSTCAGMWAGMGEAVRALPKSTRLVVVTQSPDSESPSRLRELADPDVTVVMSSDAWTDYRAPGAPYFVLVSGATGTVAGEGTARTWPQVLSLMADAGEGRVGADGDRVDAELAAAGILPGDARLYHPPIAGPAER